jgi:hypothetical protein
MLKEFDTLSAVVDDPDAGRIEAILRRVGDYLAKQPINVRTSDEEKFGSDHNCCPRRMGRVNCKDRQVSSSFSHSIKRPFDRQHVNLRGRDITVTDFTWKD